MKWLIALLALVCLPANAWAEDADSWSAPSPPFKVIGNIYSVGTEGVNAYLITTPNGHILIDATSEAGAKVVEANIRALGFKLSDIKYLVDTHAHIDHVGGMAKLKADTGAVFIASRADRYALEHGVHDVQTTYGVWHFPPVKVDRVIDEGGQVTLGGVILTAHLMPGHTKGTTSWSTTIIQNGQPLKVLFFGSMTTAGNVLIHNKTYPRIVADYRLSFGRAKMLRPDVFLANHPSFDHLKEKHAAQLAGQANAFVNAAEFPAFIAESEADFNAALAKEPRLVRKAAAQKGKP